jgi:hydroxymethylpyrimidine/phosphomethylpyrimidine kinase
VTPNLNEAEVLAGGPGSRRELAERIHELGAPAVVVTGGHGAEPIDHLFDGTRHVEIPVARHDVAATHGAGCTHSATLALNWRRDDRSTTPPAAPLRLLRRRCRTASSS